MSGFRAAVPALVCIVLAAACGTPSTSPPAGGSSSDEAEPSAPAASTDPGSPSATAAPVAGDPPPIALELVAEDLESPIGLLGAPGGWILVNEQAGRVVAVRPADGQRADVVDLSDRIRAGGEQGLLGLALHPEWPSVGRAWVHYTASDGSAILSELSGAQDADAAPRLDASSERILLQVPDPYSNHNGGQLAFGPDGYLWFGLGDGGAGGDPLGHGQDPNTLLGSILRLDVSDSGAYSVPTDNPFVGGGAPEIYLYGLRNPWRFSFDTTTGLLWIADVGQERFEEVNRIDPTSAGANLGWNIMEGAHCFEDVGCDTDGLVLPLAEYGRDVGCSITGGYVYRGGEVAGLDGWYLAGDYCTGNLVGVPSDADAPDDGTALSLRVLLATELSISSFGLGGDGEVYVADLAGGAVYRIVAGG